jgi:hypothetical protein
LFGAREFEYIRAVQMRDGYGNVHLFPKPLSEEFLAKVRTWEETEEVDDEEKVKLELYGLAENTKTVVRAFSNSM